ncbi:hypothetical protein, partial [Acinetobacter baumannii]|uniref:hypothetical protein n=1 Tax=Acinetobacter baumannii TaxID=470 RepID=UPI001C099552
VEEHFDRLRSDLTTLIEARFSNLPQGLLQFQPKLLLAPGMSYLRLNLGGPNDHIPAGSRCSFSVIDILSDGDKT